MHGQLMSGQVMLVEKALTTHLTCKLALTVALHVLVEVQLCLKHFAALPTGKVSTSSVPDSHVTDVGWLGHTDVAAKVAGHSVIATLKRG